MLDQVALQILACGPGRLRIGIDGLTAAGKTSLGDELAPRIADRGRPALRASLDDFKRPWRDRHLYDRESGEGYYRNAYDYRAVKELLLAPMGPEGSGRCSLCCIDPLTQIDHSAETIQAAEDAVLIVDGVFAFRPEIDALWDLRIWLQVDPGLCLRRGIERDRDWAGTEAEALHRNRYQGAERLYLREAAPAARADLVIDNSRFGHPTILRSCGPSGSIGPRG
jgi:uridine kinase